MATAHERLSDLLREEILGGHLRPGDQIPGELELATQYGVSRSTVRRALDTLSNANLVRRHQGKGTFVSEQGVSHVLGDLRSFTETIRDLGMTPGVTNTRIMVDPGAPAEARKFLPGAHLWLVERVRTANGQPFGFMQSWLPDALASDITPELLTETQSLYDILATKNRRPAEATETISAEGAGDVESRALDVPVGTPLLTMCRWTSDRNGRPIEFVRSTSPGDRYRYVIKLQQ